MGDNAPWDMGSNGGEANCLDVGIGLGGAVCS
jgi:hypothetical protein